MTRSHHWFRSLLFPLCLGLLLVAAPGEAGKKKGGSAGAVTQALALVNEDRAAAISKLESAISQNPSATDVDVIMVHAGEQHRLAGNAAAAQRWFDAVVKRLPTGPSRDAADLGALLLRASTGVDDQVLTMLGASPEKNVLPTQNADRYTYLALAAGKAGNPRDVEIYGKKAMDYAAGDRALSERVAVTLAPALEAARVEPPKQKEEKGEAPSKGSTPLEKAASAWDEGNAGAARTAATDALATETDPQRRGAIERFLRAIDAGPADRNKIAVLLPLSGKYAAVGKQIREALEYGYQGGPRQLVFKDTGATAETAAAALEEAVTVDRAIGVVGPLLLEETDAVVAAAEAMRVPLLSLSTSYEDTTGHHWALSGMYTRADQINALLSYVMAPERAMKSFAVFSPNSPVGQRTAAQFRASVEARGGTISTEASYSAEEQNLLPYAKQLGTREGDLGALQRAAAQAGGKAATVVVPPKLDFDGIFIPENATRTPLACAALAFEEFPMGDFSPTKGGRKIPLLGLNGWNTPSLVATGNEYTRNSIFTDVFSATVAGEADPFIVAYKAATGRSPSALEAATVDAGKLLAIASRSNASSRAQFRDALLEASISDGVTGLTQIDPKTLRGARQMYILTITRTTIEQLARVPVQ